MPLCPITDIQIELPTCSLEIAEQQADLNGLVEGKVQVWHSSGSVPPGKLLELRRLLSEDELQRAGRFRFAVDQSRFITSRGMLRALIGRYVNRAPEEIAFRYSEKDKPELADGVGFDLQFNVAHSGEVIVWAFAESRRLGVDVEKIRYDFRVSEIAERFFSVSERASLRSLPVSAQHDAFFRCWSRKEAYLKATGDGLSLPLEQFDVTLAPGQPARLLATRPDPSEAERWSMHDLDFGRGYAAALVVERESARS